MIVFLDGELVPEELAVVSVFDRGFLYGDGLFETMRVSGGRPFLWQEHMARLERGAAFLKIQIPFPADDLQKHAEALIQRNQLPEALLRLTLSRGTGPRGYSPRGADKPRLVMTLHPTPVTDGAHSAQWSLVTASVRLPAAEPLAQFKTCNKLAQIMARSEADAAGAQEALLLNTDGFVVEASSSNLFWITDGKVVTPPLVSGVLAGVTRAMVLELCRGLGIATQEGTIRPEALAKAEGVFLSLSSVGIAEGVSLDGRPLARSPLVPRIEKAYADVLLRNSAR
jgi:aminodeoxychorismate lyase